MADYGFRISKAGVDVKTGDDEDMILTSKYSLFKGSLSGNGTKSVNSSSTGTVTVNHNFNYIPLGNVFVENPLGSNWFHAPFTASGASGSITISYKFTSTTMVITFNNSTTDNHTFDYQYFIYLDKGDL